MAHFDGVEVGTVEREDRSGWPVEDRLKQRIIDGEREGLDPELEEALASGRKALSIINDVLLEGMKVVGDLFGKGEMQLPFVLQSAETMKAAVAFLEPHMEKADAGGKGVFVIGTVKGDVHDIGKNLVDIILTNNGYEVHNIGIKQPLQSFVDKAKEVEADAIGMSGLLVKSTIIMRENLHGAEQPRARRHARHARRRRAHPQLRRGRPAQGLRGPALLRQGRVRGAPHDGHPHERHEVRRPRPRVRTRGGRPQAAAAQVPARSATPPRRRSSCPARSDVAIDVPIFTPPFVGRARRQGHLARRDRRLHQRDRALPQPVAVPARRAASPTRSSRPASGRSCAPRSTRRRPRAGSSRRSRGATSR